jgi:hypothetical protein
MDICMTQMKRWKGLSGPGWRNMEFSHDDFQKFVHCWKECVEENGGDYVYK